MTPKEKAKEVVSNFYSESDFGNDMEIAKEVATSIIEDTLQEYESMVKYYKQVKQQIEQL